MTRGAPVATNMAAGSRASIDAGFRHLLSLAAGTIQGGRRDVGIEVTCGGRRLPRHVNGGPGQFLADAWERPRREAGHPGDRKVCPFPQIPPIADAQIAGGADCGHNPVGVEVGRIVTWPGTTDSPRSGTPYAMASLENLTKGTSVKGVLPDALVTVVDVKWIGTVAVELTYKDASGRLGNELLYRDREPTLEVVTAGRPWSFDGDGAMFRLVSEAHRIGMAYLFDPLLAVHTSLVEPLPHQITAVYEEMLPRQPLRFLLADDPGAGKTIMCGLLTKELNVRGDPQRCMISKAGRPDGGVSSPVFDASRQDQTGAFTMALRLRYPGTVDFHSPTV